MGGANRKWGQTKGGVAWVKGWSLEWKYHKGEESRKGWSHLRGLGDGGNGDVRGMGRCPLKTPPSPPPHVSSLPLLQRQCVQPLPSPWSASSSCSPPSSSATSATSAHRGPFWPSFLASSSSYRVSSRKELRVCGTILVPRTCGPSSTKKATSLLCNPRGVAAPLGDPLSSSVRWR